MLKQISSNVFRQKTIIFHSGLNTVLGDDEGSNSIGKSSLLMIIDFVFGGNSYIKENSDTVRHLGHHFFEFILEVDGNSYYFRRGTENSENVEECNKYFIKQESLSIGYYTSRLHTLYINSLKNISFRVGVGTFSRIAQKKNNFDSKPLKVVVNSKEKDCVNNIIKLFNYYAELEIIEKEIKLLTSQISVINKANEFDYLSKITKRKYTKNLKDIEKENDIVRRMAMELSLKINDSKTDECDRLNYELNELKRQKQLEKKKIKRIKNNLDKTMSIEGNKFEILKEYFNGVNIKKLSEIGHFHESMNSILSNELENEIKESEEKMKSIEKDIDILEKDILNVTVEGVVPNEAINTLSEVIISINEKKQENNLYLKFKENSENKKLKKEQLTDDKSNTIIKISELINDKMKEINLEIYNDDTRVPLFELSTDSHLLSLKDNTGTGRGDSNLVIFDISILELTELPFIIHDSIMFKNIGNITMSKIIKIYNSQEKQCFIAIDEISKFGNETAKILDEQSVIELSSKSVLFTKDWTGYDR